MRKHSPQLGLLQFAQPEIFMPTSRFAVYSEKSEIRASTVDHLA
jgi:hypothetical protein